MTSSKPYILVVGAPNEYHSAHIFNLLQQKGAEVQLIDTLNFPDTVTFSMRNDAIIYNGEKLPAIQGAYIRSVLHSLPPYDLEDRRNEDGELETDNWYRDYQAERQRQSLLASGFRLLSSLPIRLVNPVEAFDLHFLKPLQLEILRKAGIPVPETLVTNNPAEVIEFKKTIGHVIYKPVAGGAQCRELTSDDLIPERIERLRNAPVLFQELIPGENVRVYVLKDRIITSVLIESEELDYRQNEKQLKIIDLPRDVAKICIESTRLCGLNFTGMDLRRKADGSYVVLECNPSAMFMGIESMTGADISGPLTDFLMGKNL